MKRLFAFLALCIPIYLFAQGFGSFTHDQPYFAKDVSASQSDDPPDFPNAFFDYDVGDTNTNGDLIATLYDRTTNKFHLTASGAERPYWTNNASVFNGHGFLVFDGANNFMRTNFTSQPSPVTIYMVLTLSTDAVTQVYLDSASLPTWEFYRSPSEHGLYFGATMTAPNPDTELACVVTVRGGANPPDDVLKTNNVTWSSGSAGNNALAGLTLAASRTDTAKGKFRMARAIGYTGSHSDATQTLVYDWLRDKYFP